MKKQVKDFLKNVNLAGEEFRINKGKKHPDKNKRKVDKDDNNNSNSNNS